ncbi:hypothetical protein GLE_4932 [Lysobacter enzymogenes]|uniref:Uncharacterized protein n=1 Tax=Lysobacter enzymogenes TaxID=69 RepID=A0A0S2DP59_LYSEN|nr:hypothetical protein GLE_4932 [Lysobacter enzymogenes]
MHRRCDAQHTRPFGPRVLPRSARGASAGGRPARTAIRAARRRFAGPGRGSGRRRQW